MQIIELKGQEKVKCEIYMETFQLESKCALTAIFCSIGAIFHLLRPQNLLEARDREIRWPCDCMYHLGRRQQQRLRIQEGVGAKIC